jgi:polyisoprenoid-binding protein YceI
MHSVTRTKFVAALAAVLLLAPALNAADTYKIDPAHTSLYFSVRHLGLSNVKGHFDDFDGSVTLDKNAIVAANASIQAKSINTGVVPRDNHLRTPDFFDAADYPAITFKTKAVEKSGDHYILVADFTMRGVTKELRLPVTLRGPAADPWGKTRIGLESHLTLNRKDYGINYSAALPTGVPAVADEVAIEINAEAVKE